MGECKCACIEFPVDFSDNDIDIDVCFEEEGEFDSSFDDMDLEIPASFENVIEVNKAITDHPDLNKRGLPDQHPIGAVTSLSEELAARPSEHLTNFDIFQIVSQ